MEIVAASLLRTEVLVSRVDIAMCILSWSRSLDSRQPRDLGLQSHTVLCHQSAIDIATAVIDGGYR